MGEMRMIEVFSLTDEKYRQLRLRSIAIVRLYLNMRRNKQITADLLFKWSNPYISLLYKMRMVKRMKKSGYSIINGKLQVN